MDKQKWLQTWINSSGQITKTNPKAPPPSASTSHQDDTDIDESSSSRLKPTSITGQKRKTIEPRFIRPNAAGERLIDVTGRIFGRIIYSKSDLPRFTLENEEDDKKYDCKGKLPVFDKGFRYRMKCRLTFLHGKAQLEVVRMNEPPVEPLPVSVYEFRQVLKTKLKYPQKKSVDIAMKVGQPFDNIGASMKPIERMKAIKIPMEHIYANYAEEDWFRQLGDCWLPLKYRNFPILCNFWSHYELQNLHLDELDFIVNCLRNKPLPWFLKDQNELGLGCIPLDKAQYLPKYVGNKLTALEIIIIRVYNAFCAEIERTKCLSVTETRFLELVRNTVSLYDLQCSTSEWMDHSNLYAELVAKMRYVPTNAEKPYGLVATKYEKNYGTRYFKKTDFIYLKNIKRRLEALLRIDPGKVEKNEDPEIDVELCEEQEAALNAFYYNTNFMLICGDAGTGKSEVGKAVISTFPKGSVLSVAAYGEIANNLRKRYGAASTIDMVLERVKRRTKVGEKIQTTTRVLIIDEIGLVSAEKLARLLVALPNLQKVLMLGDHKQLPPITAGPVIDALMQIWKDTDKIQILTENHRVDENSTMLIHNFREYVAGNLENISYTNTYDANNPFHIIQRANYPKECNDPDTEFFRKKKIQIMKSELLPIRTSLKATNRDLTKTRILAQRNEDVSCLNEAWFELEYEQLGTQFRNDVFYPTITQNKTTYPGSVVRFSKNMTSKKRWWTKQIECSPVANNTTARISQIYDINPKGKYETAYKNRKQLKSSMAEKTNYQWVRVFEFEDGTKINLNDYPLKWISYGYASTICSAQGSESSNIIIWIQPSWNYIYNETLYTAMTRARETVYIICSLNGDPRLIESDIGRIQRNPYPRTENVLTNYLPIVATGAPDEIEIPNNLLPAAPVWNDADFDAFDFDNSESEEEEENSDEAVFENILNEHGNTIQFGLSRTLSADGFESPKRLKITEYEGYTEIEDTNARW